MRVFDVCFPHGFIPIWDPVDEIQELGEELKDSRQGLARMQSEMREQDRKKNLEESSGENL